MDNIQQGVLPLITGLAVGFLSGYNICKHFNPPNQDPSPISRKQSIADREMFKPIVTGIPCLVTDIGGTNCRCVLFRDDVIIAELTFDTKKYTSLSH